MKYRHEFPERFGTIGDEDAGFFCHGFFPYPGFSPELIG
jgi:hypothetical protein